ncbi:type II secretion system protein GspM [Parasalinivibrio latis]|uniref:type II secretion system protein GspM n=1 Tax=Parasalinivibrio latis TaxID=2952610 RepID=UPI0030E3B650
MKYLDSASERFEQLTPREKWLMCVTSLFGVIFVIYFLAVEPLQQKFSGQKIELESAKNSIRTQEQQLALYKGALADSPDKKIDEQITRLKADDEKLSQVLQQKVAGLVAPSEMAALLEDVLHRSKGLELVSLKSLPAEKLAVSDVASYYLHPVELSLRGRYFDLVAYLRDLEGMPVQYYWSSLDYQVDKYPLADVRLRVYTLGISPDFIGG